MVVSEGATADCGGEGGDPIEEEGGIHLHQFDSAGHTKPGRGVAATASLIRQTVNTE